MSDDMNHDDDNTGGSFDDSDQPTEVFHENSPATEVIPPVSSDDTRAYSEYDDTEGYDDYPSYQDPEDVEDNFYADLSREEYGTYHWDNLPSSVKYGSDYVVRDAYDEVYQQLLASGESEARSARRYQLAWQQLESLEADQENIRREANEDAERNRAQRNAVESDRRDIDARRAEMEADERRNLTIKIVLGVVATLLAIATVIFCMLWVSARSDRDSVSQGSVAQQEQVQQMKDNLNAMQSERDQATAENRSLSERADSLNRQVSDIRKSNEEAQKKIEERDKEIKELTDAIKEIESRPAETITETAVRESPGRTVTQTEAPSTVTVTETATP